jgi:hypothetical protein
MRELEWIDRPNRDQATLADPAGLLARIIADRGHVRIQSAKDAVAFVRAAFVRTNVPDGRELVVALALLSSHGLVHSHARDVLDQVLAAVILDDRLRRELCERILYAEDPTDGLRPSLRRLVQAPAKDEPISVFQIDGERYFMTRFESSLCVPMSLPDALRRYASAHLLRLGADPTWIVQRALRRKVSVNGGRGIAMGALDVIAERAKDLPTALVQRALTTCCKASVGAVKLRAYEVGVGIYGKRFAEPARRDGDRKVRSWAARMLDP